MSFDQDKLDSLLQQLRWVCDVLEKNLPPVLEVLEQEVAALWEDLEAERRNASADQEDGGRTLPLRPEQMIIQEGGYSQKNENLVVQEYGGSLPLAQEVQEATFKVQEAVDTQEEATKLYNIPTLDMSLIQEDWDFDFTECQDSYIDGDGSLPSDLKTLSVPMTSVMESGSETLREGKMMLTNSGLPTHGLATDFRTPGTWRSTRTAFEGLANATTPVSSLVSSSMDSGSSLSSSFDSKMQRTSAQVLFLIGGSASLVCFLPLSSTSSPASLFQFIGRRDLRRTDYVFASRCMELSMWHVQKFSWLEMFEFEESNSQLAHIFSKYQGYFDDPLGWELLSEYMGFVFQEKDPKSFLPCIYWLLTKVLFCCQLPTLCENLTWFKGCLIKMLVGSGLIQGIIYLAKENIQWIIAWSSAQKQ